ncbi:GTPase IMAP family member 8 isoform X4 [Silurus asotus]|uniref:GTPase IMAP family member 8 isoform X4 n=1 Tax=Silurus asotus TaxID=30991 RepID=A0AAD5AQ18_SILAS|nr:GTPase IMAP family member 8 isoform X4 [Silurus asotus]
MISSSAPSGVQFISEFRIVLLGNKGAGKTSLANMILCRETSSPKSTAQCTRIRGVAAGRLVTLVDSPGWWKNFLLHETPEFQKQELVLSVAHCQPGPHAVLLVIRVDASYTDKNKRAAQQHMELLGKDVWKHTVVVFTYGDRLQDQAVEQHVSSEGETFLRWLVGKCGNRYHILNIDRYNGTQVKELLEMIEDMVAGNGGSCYKMDQKCLCDVKDIRRVAEEKAEKSRKMVQEHRNLHEGQDCSLSNIRIVLLGFRRSGKSSVRNNIFGRENINLKRTSQCVKTQSEVAGKVITVLDTPGWWKTLEARDTAELDKQEILRSTCLCPPGPHALLLTLRLDMKFRNEEMKSLEEHVALLGEQAWNHTILLFTHRDLLCDLTVEQYIEGEGNDLKLLAAKCGNRYHVLNNKNLLDGGQVTELFKKVEEMVAENQGRYYEMHPRTSKEVRRKWRLMEKKSKMKVKAKHRRTISSVKGAGQYLTELSLVLLGYGEAGKTSASNTILDATDFGIKRTSRCVKKKGYVEGRLLTVIDTPGWWKRLPIEETPQFTKQEILQSVFLTPPGPVSFLLVIRLDSSFQEEEKRSVKDHLNLFGDTVWDQTMVLFTCGDWLGDRSIELYIESEGEALKWILEQCGNRFHILSNKHQRSSTQVAELLTKIEEMLAENKACHSGMWDLKQKTERNLENIQSNERGIHRQTDDVDSDDDDVFTTDVQYNII